MYFLYQSATFGGIFLYILRRRLVVKTAVLTHGCHLQACGWHELVWGDLPNELGRVPRAILTALEFDASALVFSTGASRDEETGLFEGEYIYQFTREHLHEMVDMNLVNMSLKELDEWLQQVARLEIESQNTKQEVEYSARICVREDIKRLVLVSNPFHVLRCLKDALSVFEHNEELRHFRRTVLAVPAETGSADKTVVIEEPHRGDDAMIDAEYQLHDVVPRFFKLPPKEREEALKGLSLLLEEYSV